MQTNSLARLRGEIRSTRVSPRSTGASSTKAQACCNVEEIWRQAEPAVALRRLRL